MTAILLCFIMSFQKTPSLYGRGGSTKLEDHINNIIVDAECDPDDSFAGLGSWQSQIDLQNALYELLEIPKE